MNKDLLTVLERCCGRRVLVVGDVMLDAYAWGESTRLSPEAPVPVIEILQRTYLPGGAGSAAACIRALGAFPVLVGLHGSDESGQQVRRALEEAGVSSAELIADGERRTTVKTRLMAQGQQIARIDDEERSQISRKLEDALLLRVEELTAETDVCLLSDYGKGVVSARLARAVVNLYYQACKPVVVDPKGRDYTKYRGATLVKPNVHELEQASGEAIGDDQQLERAARRVTEVMQGAALLVTRGAAGMSLLRGGVPTLHLPAQGRQVFDVTGAGDAVVASVCSAISAGASLETGARLAGVVAGLAVGKRGATPVSSTEVLQALSK